MDARGVPAHDEGSAPMQMPGFTCTEIQPLEVKFETDVIVASTPSLLAFRYSAITYG